MLIKKVILLVCNFIFLLFADEASGAVVTKTPAYAKSRIEDISGVKIPSDAKMVFHYYSRTSWQENDEQYSVFEFKSEPTEWLMSNSFSDEKNELLPICSIGIVKKKKRRNRFGYAVLRYNYLVLKSFNYLSSFSVILFRTLQSKPFSEFIG